MTHFHQMLASPTAADIQAGAAELVQADRATEKSRREAAYLKALHPFFDGYQPQNHLQHATAYANAMATMQKIHLHDLEAKTFYALALLAAEPPNDERQESFRDP